MAITKRDKAIISDLNRFRVMDRDSVAEIHFANLKNPQYAANNVLLRLLRDGHIQRSTSFVPYCYFGPDVSMKKNSAKIGHFLAILETYKEIRKQGKAELFQVEPKYGSKGVAEPDVLCIFRKTPFFIEVQKTIYSEKQMREKLARYEDLFHSGIVLGEPWQRPDQPLFPHVLILSEQRYAIDGKWPFRVFQAQSFTQFLLSLQNRAAATSNTDRGEIKIKIGH